MLLFSTCLLYIFSDVKNVERFLQIHMNSIHQDQQYTALNIALAQKPDLDIHYSSSFCQSSFI